MSRKPSLRAAINAQCKQCVYDPLAKGGGGGHGAIARGDDGLDRLFFVAAFKLVP